MRKSTLEIAKNLNLNHRSIYRLVTLYINELKEFGDVILNSSSKKIVGGRPANYYELNNKQEIFLIMLTKNNEKTVENKMRIIKNLLYKG